MLQDNSELVFAFPLAVRDDATKLALVLPEPHHAAHTFQVFVGQELVRIPHRVYHDVTLIEPASLSKIQIELLDCLLTRHHDGHVREGSLRKILDRNDQWVPPFVVQLAGEYVIEILSAIRDGLEDLDCDLYRSFLISNPEFLRLTKQRVASYRDCYYRHLDKGRYVGFEIVNFLDSLVASHQ